MAKKTKTKRKSATWWVSLDKQCKSGCCEYAVDMAVGVSQRKPSMLARDCGCVVLPVDACGFQSMSLAQYRARFANAPELEPGGPPVKVRLRMEVA